MIAGIGGVFFKVRDVSETKSWYARHLGLDTDDYGAMFKCFTTGKPQTTGYLQWSPMNQSTAYMGAAEQQFMINYRVQNLEMLVTQLKELGVFFYDDIETFDYGKFVHIRDGDGRKVELWEPIDAVFDNFYSSNP